MTLKEKFKERLYNQSHDDSEYLRIRFENIDKVIDSQEKIADEHAIGFAEWLYRYDNTRLPNGNWIIKLGLKPYTSEEVLEIYKKTL
jgi:hypothetical protein